MKKFEMLFSVNGFKGVYFTFDPYNDMIIYDEEFEIWDGTRKVEFIELLLNVTEDRTVTIHLSDDTLVHADYAGVDLIGGVENYEAEFIVEMLKTRADELLSCYSYILNNPKVNTQTY